MVSITKGTKMISVVIAVKNEVNYIKECLESLEKQSFSDYEIILVDGRSNDGTKELLQKRLERKPTFLLLDNEKGDAAAGRNIGIEKAKGDIIAFMDADAFADKDWLKNIENKFKQIEDKNTIGIGGPILIPKNQPFKSYAISTIMASPLASGGKLNPSIQHKFIKEVTYVGHIPTGNLAVKKDIFKKEGAFDERFLKGQDLELSTRLVKKGYKFLYDPEIKVWHYEKVSLGSFSRQIFKWALAKMMVIKKHGFNFAYLLPIFVLCFEILLALLSFIYYPCFIILILTLAIYSSLILYESVKIAHENKKLFLYALLLLPLIHLSYSLGLIKGLFKKL